VRAMTHSGFLPFTPPAQGSNSSFVTAFRRGFQRFAAIAVAALAFGCGNAKGDFVGARVLDPCSGTWPVCSTIVGCILGPESYAEGRLPRSTGFIVSLGEPSTVRLAFYLDNVGAAGTQTNLHFWEGGCRSQTPVQIEGKTFLTESQSQGQVLRDVDLQDIGDHLIQFDSDASANYVVKVDLISKRTQ
jgi:hypothetical protein